MCANLLGVCWTQSNEMVLTVEAGGTVEMWFLSIQGAWNTSTQILLKALPHY